MLFVFPCKKKEKKKEKRKQAINAVPLKSGTLSPSWFPDKLLCVLYSFFFSYNIDSTLPHFFLQDLLVCHHGCNTLSPDGFWGMVTYSTYPRGNSAVTRMYRERLKYMIWLKKNLILKFLQQIPPNNLPAVTTSKRKGKKQITLINRRMTEDLKDRTLHQQWQDLAVKYRILK